AVNGPSAVLVAGEVGPLEALERSLSARGVFARRVKVDYASHCGQMDALRGPLLEQLGGLSPRAGAVALASTVTGEVTDGSGLDAAYWADNLRQTVRLDRAVQALVNEGVRLFVEVSPHPVLVPALEGLVRGVEGAAVVGSTRREQPERARLLESLGALYARGASVRWQGLYGGTGRSVELPTYAFRRERFWLEAPARAASARGGHPLLGEGREVSTEAGGWLFEAEVDGAGSFGEHRVRGAALLPAAAFVEMALQAGKQALGGEAEVRGLKLQQPLVLGESSRRVQAVVRGDGALVVSSRGEGEKGWTVHAKAELRRAEPGSPEPESIVEAGKQAQAPEAFYASLAAKGLEYGPAFQGVAEIYAGAGEVVARLERTERVRREQRSYGWHPALLDAALQATGACVEDGRTWVPASLGRVRAAPGGGARASQVRARVERVGPDRYEGVVQVLDEGGRVLLAVEGLQLAPLREGDSTGAWLHHVRWEGLDKPADPSGQPGAWVVLADRGGVGRTLAARLEAQGAVVKVVEAGDAYGPGTLNPGEPEHFRRLFLEAFEGGRTPCRGVIDAWALDDASGADTDVGELLARQELGPVALSYLVQALAQIGWRDAPRLWVLTRDAQRVAGSAGRAIGQASVWGLARTLAYEHPELRATALDLDPSGVGDEDALRLMLAGGPDEMVALRAGCFYAARLAAGLPEGAKGASFSVAPDATYLITGGLGGLGLLLAERLVERGARHLALVGRRPPSEPARAVLERLRARGAEVRTFEADVGRARDVAAVVGAVRATMPPLRGLVHAAAVL
ncbi:MAG TPA: SDR family NAD(P)-dependent oxidoreductase, partial [Polyangiaceae bacterium]|nr:SDR family NAD(P)-dependent oxidoreductase [Polyangiaceae bacterium]